MLRLAADENVKHQLLVALRRRFPRLDLTTVLQAGLAGSDDPTVLAWAAAEGRVLLTHDVRTMPFHAYRRLAAGEPMPGVVVIPDLLAIGRALDDLALLLALAGDEDVNLQVFFLPL